jgi:hypothetical protein
MENAPMPDPISTTEDTSPQGYPAAYFKTTSMKIKWQKLTMQYCRSTHDLAVANHASVEILCITLCERSAMDDMALHKHYVYHPMRRVRAAKGIVILSQTHIILDHCPIVIFYIILLVEI